MPETVIMQHFQVASKPDGSLWELGRGAMGVTYKAVDTELGGTVALKVINTSYLNDTQARERFLREARAAAYLHHPNIASVFHLGREGDVYFYAMEFVEGETLQSVVAREGALPPRLALRMILQAAQGLFAANERGLIHRDIKPANLMLTRHKGGGDPDDDDLLVKVIDFGLAKSTAPTEGPNASLTGGGPIGTPYYMSPEQIEPAVGAVDARSDIYSLGVTLWCLLTGKPPFQGTQFQIFSQHLHQPPPSAQLESLHLPAGVSALLARMLAKDPADRPADHRELIAEIKALLRTMPESTTATANGANNDPDLTTLHPPAAAAKNGTPPAPPPSTATAGFPLVDVLRTRGSLPAADVLRLMEVLAPEVDAARRAGPPDLRPVAVGLRFSPPPANLDALPRTPVRQWPAFTATLHRRTEGSGDSSSGEETLLPGSAGDFSADDVTRLAMLIYELLAGQPPASLTREAFASPIPALGEAANAILWRTATGQGRFGSATEFGKAFSDAAQTDGSLARADLTASGHSSLAASGERTVVAPPPDKNARRFALLGVFVVAMLAAGGWIVWRAAHPVSAPVVAAASPKPIFVPPVAPVVVAPSVAPPAMPVESATATPSPSPSPSPMEMPSTTPALADVAPPAPAAMPYVPPPASPAASEADAEKLREAQEAQEEKLLAAQEAQTKAARTLRVPKQFPTIQAAIDAAQSGDTVSVSAGRYKESLRFKEGLRLIGADRDTVTVTGPADANVLAVIDCSFGKIAGITFKQTPPAPGTEAQPAVFFKNSGVQFTSCRVANSAGIGIYLRGKDHSTVENCEVKDAGSDGIHIMDAGASPTIRGNHIEGGKTHGILLHMHGNGTIINNVSEKNAGSGIIMMGEGVNPQLQGNKFLNNRKWGIQIARPAAPNIGADNVTKGNELGATHEETLPATPAPMPGMQGM